MCSLIFGGLTLCFVSKANRHIQQFFARIRPFIFYKADVCIEPSIMKAQCYFVLLQIFLFQKLTHQISNLHII